MRIKKHETSSFRAKQRKLETALLESQLDAMDLVNPNEAYLDPQTGETWLPLGSGLAVDIMAAPYRTESELRLIRQRARITALKNPYAKNLLNSIIAFTVGKGHKYTVTPRKNLQNDPSELDVARKVARRVQSFIDKLLKMNRWGRRQQQNVRRWHRDGETIIRLFPQDDGFTIYRHVEPSELATPSKLQGMENATFGIVTDPEDVETVEAYYISGEKVLPEEIQHRKANVDMNFKRGLSTLFTIREHLDRALKLLRNMSITVANQTALTAIRHHKATARQVQSFAARNAQASRYNSSTGADQKQASFSPGTIVDLIDGKTRYEFPGSGLNSASPVQVLSAELRAIASAMSWPEFMIGSDSSNANYSSTMVAENPAVKSIETEQAEHIEDDLELLWAAVEHAVNVGRLPAEALTHVEIEVEAPIIVSRDPKQKAETDQILNLLRVKSPQTIAAEHNLDYSQEAMNFGEHEDGSLDADPLNGPPNSATAPAGNTDDVQKTALNGAQLVALADLVQRAAAGSLPPDTVREMILAGFPGLDAPSVQRILQPLNGFKPAPLPAPAKGLAA